MKKLLFAVVLSLAGVGLSTGQANAWLCHKCCKSCATICVRPYNAFSPSAFGSICADGCCPLQFGRCCPPPPPCAYGQQGPCCGPSLGCAMDGACGCGAPGDAHAALMNGPAAGAPAMAPQGAPVMLPAGAAPGFQAPAQMPPNPATSAVGYPMGVQAAGYRAPAGYYPGYAPMPWMQPAAYPTYWNTPYPYGR